jgi:hypothetical protein
MKVMARAGLGAADAPMACFLAEMKTSRAFPATRDGLSSVNFS